MAQRAVLLDTSFVLALENSDDRHHEKAKQLDRQLLHEGFSLVLHWGILLEIGDGYARIGRRAKGLQLLELFLTENGYDVRPLTESLMNEAMELYRTRVDKEWGLTDCISFILMKTEGLTDALTADTHFEQAGFTAKLLH